jgi:bifunctional oligoribonuclease and PAP phosphatase NrnA
MNSYSYLVDKISSSKNILLTTHKSCDGDGLGSELAVYYCLEQMNKNVKIVHQEVLHDRYKFIDKEQRVKKFDPTLDFVPDVIIAFDTNDHRIIEPVYSHYKDKCEIIFVDHHALLVKGPNPTENSIVDSDAASTGEMTYKLIKALGVPMNQKIAEALYTSIAFDTHVFKFIRNSQASFQIANELMNYNIDCTWIHRMLFANYSANKVKFLGLALKDIEFSHDNQVGLLMIPHSIIQSTQVEAEEIHDLVDYILGVNTCEIAVVARELEKNQFRLSFRSKGKYKVLPLAEKFDGGGHELACGAFVNSESTPLKEKLIKGLDAFF